MFSIRTYKLIPMSCMDSHLLVQAWKASVSVWENSQGAWELVNEVMEVSR